MFAIIKTMGGRIVIGLGIAAFAAIAVLVFRLQTAQETIAARDAEIAHAIAANETLVVANTELQKQATRDGAILRELRDVQTRLAAVANDRRNQIDRLAEDNPDVATFLDIPIPDALRVRHAPNGDADGDSPDSSE
jgi:two-component sensor histidine kinase